MQGYNKFLEQSLDEIRGKVGWVERDGDDVKEWLEEGGFLGEEELS